MRSAAVTFDYATNCDGSKRPQGHATRFFKVVAEVASGGPPTGIQPSVTTDWVIVRIRRRAGSSAGAARNARRCVRVELPPDLSDLLLMALYL